MELDLPFIWAGLIAVAVLLYVILDGFDLGIGVLFPFLADEEDRDVAMNTVAPVWDGNETWLVLGGGGLFAVFPLAYAVIMPALYAPLLVMLLGLLFRGVAFEYRWRIAGHKSMWSFAFAAGSYAATFAQGVALGALIQGIPVANRAYAGGWWDWLTPFSMLTGVALVVGYGLLGATWLIMKTEGELQRDAYRYAGYTAVGTLGLIGVVSVWTPFLNDVYMARWFVFPQILYVVPVPLLVTAAAFVLWRSLVARHEYLPFLAALALFILSYIGLGIGFYPYIVPHTVTIWDAAGPDSSLWFLLAGTIFLLPIILMYTAYSYWVFRGKVNVDSGYH
ncbi:MAG: cytochrome d ubiquinol oxidase subunit II [Pseudomonadota bacterium]